MVISNTCIISLSVLITNINLHIFNDQNKSLLFSNETFNMGNNDGYLK